MARIVVFIVIGLVALAFAWKAKGLAERHLFTIVGVAALAVAVVDAVCPFVTWVYPKLPHLF